MSPTSLAVIILTWNGREDVLACLTSLAAAGHPGDGETFVIVDNGSTDGTLEAVAERFSWAERLQNGANLGFAGGNNVGLRWALERGFGRVMLLNNDTEVAPGALESLVAFMDRRPEAGSAQALLINHRNRDLLDSTGIELFSLPGAMDRQMGNPVAVAAREPEEIFGPTAAAAVYSADALREAGLLDEAFFVLLEDVDLAFRLRLAGYSSFLVPAARVFHKRGISAKGRAEGEKKYILHRNLRALALRYWPRKYLLQYGPFLAKGWMWSVAYAARHGRWAEWSALMRRSRQLRGKNVRSGHWREMCGRWMRRLGWAYYGRKIWERITGKPAIG